MFSNASAAALGIVTVVLVLCRLWRQPCFRVANDRPRCSKFIELFSRAPIMNAK